MPEDPSQWVGREESRRERLSTSPAALLAATLDRGDVPRAGAALPVLWHWLYFLADAPQSQLRADGHPLASGVLPQVALPRRMFAGARLQVARPLRLEGEVSRRSRIADVSTKHGKSGLLLFLLIRHEYFDGDGLAMVEEQDVVYREAAPATAAAPPPAPAPMAPAAANDAIGAAWKRQVRPDEALLFRYSALTFNAHRIHYDRTYTTSVEGYPGLVVQGMLVATLLADLLHRNAPQAQVREFRFRAVAPLYCGAPFTLCGAPGANGKVRLWAVDAAGTVAMEASAQTA